MRFGIGSGSGITWRLHKLHQLSPEDPRQAANHSEKNNRYSKAKQRHTPGRNGSSVLPQGVALNRPWFADLRRRNEKLRITRSGSLRNDDALKTGWAFQLGATGARTRSDMLAADRARKLELAHDSAQNHSTSFPNRQRFSLDGL